MVDFLCDGYVIAEKESDDLNSGFIRSYIANGTVGMLRKWILADFPIDSHQSAEMMYFLSRKPDS